MGIWGSWSEFTDTSCNGNFIVGANIEFYNSGGGFDDRRGATNLRMFCSDGKVREGTNTDKTT